MQTGSAAVNSTVQAFACFVVMVMSVLSNALYGISVSILSLPIASIAERSISEFA